MIITQKNKDLFKLLKLGNAKVNPLENEINLTKATVKGSQQEVSSTYNSLPQNVTDLLTQQGITSAYMTKTLPDAYTLLTDALDNMMKHSWFIIGEFSQRVAICYSYHNNLKFLDDTYTGQHPPFQKTFEYLSDVSSEDLNLIANLALKIKDDWKDISPTSTAQEIAKVAADTKDFVAQAKTLSNHVADDITHNIKFVEDMVNSNTNGWIAKVLPTWNSDDSLSSTIDLIFSQGVKDILSRPE